MATNIFSPWSGQTYSYDYGSNLGGSNSAYNIWGSQSNNPYITYGPTYTPGVLNPNTGTPILQPQPQPLQVSTGGDDSFPDNPPVGDGLSFGYGYSNTSPGYSGPYSNNPLDSERSFMDKLGEAASNYMNNYSIFGIAANALSPYDPVSYAQSVGVAKPVTFSTKTAQDYINESVSPSYSSDLAASGYNQSNTSSDSWSESDYSGSGWSSDPSADAMAEAETSYDSL